MEETATAKAMKQAHHDRFMAAYEHMSDRERDCFHMGMNLANAQWAERFSDALNKMAPTANLFPAPPPSFSSNGTLIP